MKLMINVPKEEYKRVMDGKWEGNPLADYIENGKPIQKGHGDLIDRQELLKSTLCKTFGLRSVDIENAPTIIEADTESEE